MTLRLVYLNVAILGLICLWAWEQSLGPGHVGVTLATAYVLVEQYAVPGALALAILGVVSQFRNDIPTWVRAWTWASASVVTIIMSVGVFATVLGGILIGSTLAY